MSTNTSTSYTFAKAPTEMTPFKAVKYNDHVLTYNGVDYFSWGATIIGKEIELTWPWLSSAQYETLQSFYESENTYRFFSSAHMPTTYYCQVTDFDAKHWYGTGEYLDARMTLLLTGTAT
jgi:hypothetical protein